MQRSVIRTLLAAGILTGAACARVDDINGPSSRVAAVAVIPQASLTQSAPGAVPAPAGLRACFSGETSALDVVGNNVGQLMGGASYAPGKFGQGFDFHALGDGIAIPANASLNVGPGAGITMAAWIYGRGTMFQSTGGIVGAGPIMEFDNGAHLWHHNQQNDPTGLFTNLAEGNDQSQWHILQAPGTVPLNGWHHTAVTYAKATGVITLYVDGVAVATSNQGSFSPNTSTAFHIGQRVTPVVGDPTFTFNGTIDEVQLYDRGLSAAEIGQLASATGTMCVAPPASFQVLQMPVGSGESGVPFTTQPVVAILDANGNIVSNATTPVTVSVASGSGTLLGTTTVNAVNGIATFTNLAIAGVGSTSLSFSAGALPAASSAPSTSEAIPTSQVARQLAVVTQPGGATSGQPLAPQPVVEIRDAAGLRVTGATNPVTVSVGSGTVTLAGTTTVAAVDGRATFTNLALSGSGGATLAFASGGLTGATSASVTIAGLPATELAVLTQPSANAESGVPFTAQPVVELRDATGARALSAAGTVTAAIYSGTGGTLVGTTTATIANGLATFSNLQVNGPGTFVLRFTSGSLPPVNSAPVTVTQVVRIMAITAAPATITNGVLMSPPYTVELRDAANIKVSTANLLVRMGIAAGTGTVAGTNEKVSTNGVVTFTDVTVTATGAIQFSFWLIDASVNFNAYTLSTSVNVQANDTEPPPSYDWHGFFDPIDNPPKVNKVEGGATVPIKFSLGGDQGLDVFAPGYPASQPASCTNFAPTGELAPILALGSWGDPGDDDNEWEYDHDYKHCKDKKHHQDHRHKKSRQKQDDDRRRNRGGSSDDDMIAALQFNNGRYQINWKTDQWDGSCRILVVKLNDGSTHTANFRFK
ncbi:MAG TPA: PxKF domain-containing protein [Gemmatimonadaceae bacterium]|nr:PxKF domain-containing protein [Gemmatimonadaceae bacterium]